MSPESRHAHAANGAVRRPVSLFLPPPRRLTRPAALNRGVGISSSSIIPSRVDGSRGRGFNLLSTRMQATRARRLRRPRYGLDRTPLRSE